MKRNFTKIMAALALLVFTMPSLVAWGQDNYVVEFASTTTSNDGTAAITTLADIVSSGADYITSITDATKVYKGKQGYGVKLGSSSAVGSFVMNLSNAGKVEATSIVFNSCKYGSDNSSLKITINGSITQTFTLTADLTDYTYTFSNATEITSIKIEGVTKRIYVKSMTVNYGGTPTSTCATPTFNPAAGTYTQAQNVTISCATEGATIYYTTNGDVPTTSSTVYTAAINVSTNTTIKAMAVAEGYNNSAVATAEYTIEEPSFNQDWEGTMHGWSFVSVTGDQVWSIGTYSNNKYAKMSGYSNGNNANEDWCISPAFNLGDYTNPVLTFTTARSQHNGNELEVYFSNNYNGDPTAATWTQLTCTLPAQPSSGYSEFTSSGNISLSSYSGSNCYIGFKYTSTTSAAATWELDDIVLESQSITPTITLTPSSIDLGNNNATDVQISKTFTVSQSNLTEGIVLNASIGDLTTTTIAQGAEDTEITWTYTPTEAGSISATITATSTGAETQTLTITGAAVAPVTGDRYEMVTEAPQDWSGCYIITGTNSGNYYALTGVDSNLGTTAAVTVVGNSIASNTTTDGYQVIVSQTTNGYSLYMDGVGYLYYSGSKNELYASGTFTESTSEWTFSISDNLVTLANVNNTDRKIQFNYNNGNSRFACYASNQVKLTLFKYTGTVVLPPVINVTNNTVSLEYDATEGSIAYTIDNPVAGTNLTANSEAEWISNITVADDKVNFTTTVNEGNSDRTATITLSYTGATDKDVTVTQGRYVAPFEGGTYTLATSIESGKTYIIVGLNDEDAYAMGLQRDNNRGAVGISINGTTATVDADVEAYEFVIESAGTSVYSIYDARTPGYLYAASSSSNYLRTETALDENGNGKWAISIEEEGASIVAQGTNTRNVMQFNYSSSSQLFSCYGSASQKAVYLYVKDETPVTETYTLDITGYTDVTEGNNNKGYYLIASPVTVDPSEVDGMTEGGFDLYYYDQAGDGEGNEWINYEPNVFNLVPGTGYLYAKKATAETPSYSFNLTGAPYTGTGEIPVAAGWNLIGNPFGVEAEISSDYYALTYESNELIATTAATHVAAMQGVFVNADEDDTVIFEAVENNTPGKGQNIALNLSKATRGASTIDRAIVRFDEGQQLPKFQLFENSTKLYIPQGNKDYAIVRSAAQGEMPVSFRASENGTYTIAVEAENVDMNYLHLIDNMTGADVDLLATPNYTFEARTNDYTSRFRLVFSANSIDEQTAEAFAYFNGTNWTVSNTGDATLQVVDITGRIVSSETINGNATVSINQPAGIYMLRLVNGNDVKVQKVVVR